MHSTVLLLLVVDRVRRQMMIEVLATMPEAKPEATVKAIAIVGGVVVVVGVAGLLLLRIVGGSRG